MKTTLYFKFLLAYCIFGCLSFLSVSTVISDLTLYYLEATKAEQLYKVSNLIVSNYTSGFYTGSNLSETVRTELNTIAAYLDSSIWVVDFDGNILLNSDKKISEESPQKIEQFDPTSTGANYYQIGKFYGMFQEKRLSVICPFTSDYSVKGYVMIHTSMQNLLLQRDHILNIIYQSLGIIFLLSLLIMIVFTFLVYIPLKKITIAANEYAKGNLSYNLEVTNDDEIGYLAASLNYMSSELSKTEENQRKFIANISHDFRSPLTSIKGYLEAILDGTIPPEMQDKYLNIVLFETDRLNKLTSSLLTLNNFDAKGTFLDITSFNINHVIKNTAASFEGTCTKKKISIELLSDGKQLYVSADMGKIQQVLYNLIDNAIKFSNNNSVITVETAEKGGKVFVSVKDSGIGIPKDSLKKIWDRFYKTDLSRGKDKRGTGLGLSITKEIIQAHNENINVISTKGVGSEFIFTLPKAKMERNEE